MNLVERLRKTVEAARQEQCLYGGWGIMELAAAEIEQLQATIKKQEMGLACLRGIQRAGDNMRDDLRREWKKSEDEVERLQVELVELRE